MTDLPRFLHPHATASTQDYVSQPLREVHDDTQETRERIGQALTLRDEPEAPSAAWVDAQCELAAKYDRMRRVAAHEQACVERQAISIENRIQDAQRRARRKRLNFDHEITVISKLIDRGKDAGIRRLERLEALLDGVLNEEQAA